MKVTLKASKHKVSHPTRPGLMKVGESADASELWVRQHLPLVNAGVLVVDDAAPAKKKRAPRKKKAK